MASKKKKVSRRRSSPVQRLQPDECRMYLQQIVQGYQNLMADISEAQQMLRALELRDPKAEDCPF